MRRRDREEGRAPAGRMRQGVPLFSLIYLSLPG